MTQHNVFSMIEKTRLERTHNDYMQRDGKPSSPNFFHSLVELLDPKTIAKR